MNPDLRITDMTEIIKRNNCTVCGLDNLDYLLTTPPLPVFQGCVTAPEETDIEHSQNWSSCSICGTVQLTSLLPLELVYLSGHATSSGKLWDEHHAAFAKFISRHVFGAVCEVGGGVGKLARSFRNIGGMASWYNLEPNPVTTNEDHIANYTNLREFLDADFETPINTGTIVFSHCLEHVYSLAEIILLLTTKLPLSGKVVISWPMIEKWLSTGVPGALNWEHTFYCPISTLKQLFKSYGFSLVEEQYFGEHHSVFIIFEYEGTRSSSKLFKVDVEKNRKEVINYFRYFDRQVLQLKQILKDAPMPIFMMPASVYSQYLYAFGIKECKLKGLLDNDSLKQGRRLYGTSLKAFSPTEISIRDAGTVLLNAGAHSAEITQQLAISNPNLLIINAEDTLK